MQWVNQTYNAGVNYGNRSASSDYTTEDFGKGYLGAVGASIGIALASRRLFAPRIAALTGTTAIFASAGLNYIATGSAGGINCALMRSKEVFEGIDVQDESGRVTYGKSQAAGYMAVKQTALSRVFLPLPVLFFPAFCNLALVKSGLWPKSTTAGKLIEFGLCITSLAIALPASIALFKSRASLPVEQMEEQF
jgi:hypothetical protein